MYAEVAQYSDDSNSDMETPAEHTDPKTLPVWDFKEIPQFLPIAQSVIAENIHNCPYYAPLAEAQAGEGDMFFHVFDLRAPPPAGRIPYVEDILGTLRLEEGKVVPKSYQPNSMYRVATHDGVFTVSSYLTKLIRKAVESS